jgi:hypothetical protein
MQTKYLPFGAKKVKISKEFYLIAKSLWSCRTSIGDKHKVRFLENQKDSFGLFIIHIIGTHLEGFHYRGISLETHS